MKWELPVPKSWVNNLGLGFLDKMKDGTFHPGYDFNNPRGGNSDLGAPICVCADGINEYSKDDKTGFGKHIYIKHELPSGVIVYSHYAHNEVNLSQKGDRVSCGQRICSCGYSGRYEGNWWTSHLHFEICREALIREFGFNFWPKGWSKEKIEKYYYDPIKFIEEQAMSIDPDEIFQNCFITQAQRWPNEKEIEEWHKSNNPPYTYVQNNAPNPLVEEQKKLYQDQLTRNQLLNEKIKGLEELNKGYREDLKKSEGEVLRLQGELKKEKETTETLTSKLELVRNDLVRSGEKVGNLTQELEDCKNREEVKEEMPVEFWDSLPKELKVGLYVVGSAVAGEVVKYLSGLQVSSVIVAGLINILVVILVEAKKRVDLARAGEK